MKDHPAGEWAYIATEVTDKTGRIFHTLADDKALGYGIYPVKMVVRGDHTSVDFYLAVVPPKTECVVFSIDGSFTASVSVTGRDPKVRAGAVDVVRYIFDFFSNVLKLAEKAGHESFKVAAYQIAIEAFNLLLVPSSSFFFKFTDTGKSLDIS